MMYCHDDFLESIALSALLIFAFVTCNLVVIMRKRLVWDAGNVMTRRVTRELLLALGEILCQVFWLSLKTG